MNLTKTYYKLLEKQEEYPRSIKDVNNYLKKKGVKEKLAKGRGYFYFYDGGASGWYESGVYVYHIDELSLDDWYDEYLRLSKA